MNKNSASTHSSKQQTAAQRLMQELKRVSSQAPAATPTDFETLSIVVEDAVKGIDISKRYPALYLKLAADPTLRETFLDALELAEKDRKGGLIPLYEAAEAARPNLNFLEKLPAAIQMHWQRTIEQLQFIFFSPSSMVYRSGTELFDGPWFELLETETEIDGTAYNIMLQCTPSENPGDGFSIFLTVDSQGAVEQLDSPLRAQLQWGNSYNEQVLIVNQGRVQFPDILLSAIFDTAKEKVSADLNFTLEVNP